MKSIRADREQMFCFIFFLIAKLSTSWKLYTNWYVIKYIFLCEEQKKKKKKNYWKKWKKKLFF